MVSWKKLPENEMGSLAYIFKILVTFSSLEANSIFTFQKEAYNLDGRECTYKNYAFWHHICPISQRIRLPARIYFGQIPVTEFPILATLSTFSKHQPNCI